MKIKVNLNSATIEYLDATPYIQGEDSRNRLIVYVPTGSLGVIDDDPTDEVPGRSIIAVSYKLPNGRDTIKLFNDSIIASSDTDNYISGLDGYVFAAPEALTRCSGEFMAAVTMTTTNGKIVKFNVLNTILDSTNFEAFESALEEAQSLWLSIMNNFANRLNALDTGKANMTDSTQDITAKSLTAETLTATTKVNTPVIDMEADLDNPAYIDINGKHKALFTEDLMVIFQKAANNFNNLGLVLAEDTFHVVLKDANDTTFGLTLSPSGGFSVFTGSNGFNFDGTKIEINNEELSTKTYVDDNTIGVIEIGTNTGTLTASQLLLLSRPDCIVKNTNTLEYYRKTNTYVNGSYRFEYKTIYIYDNVKYLETKYCTISNAGAWEFGIDDIPFYDRTQADNKFALITETGNKIQLEMNSTTFKIVAKLYDKNNTLLSTSSEIDLPMESVVVSGEYDEETQKVILTLQNGSTIEFSIADLIDGLQAEITSENPLDADLVDDTNATHKFVSAEEKAQITDNANNITALQSGKQNVINSSHMLSSDLVNPATHKNKFVRYVDLDFKTSYTISNEKYQEIFSATEYGDVILRIQQKDANNNYYTEVYRFVKPYWESTSDYVNEKLYFCGTIHWIEIARNYNENTGITTYSNFHAGRDTSGLTFEADGRIGVDYNYVQSKLTFDDTPTTSSDNPVKSSGIKSYSDNNLQQAKDYTDQKISEFAWMLGGNDLSVDTDSDVAYTKTVPNGVYATSGTPKAVINSIGSMSYKSENLYDMQNPVWDTPSQLPQYDSTINGYSFSSTDAWFRSLLLNCRNGQKYTMTMEILTSSTIENEMPLRLDSNTTGTQLANSGFYGTVTPNTWSVIKSTFTPTTDTTVLNFRNEIQIDFSVRNIMLVEGETEKPYKEYFSDIRDSAVTSVVSKDSNNNVIDTFNVPAEVQALSDYGVGVSNSVNNVVDLITKTYQRKSYSVVLNGSEEGWSFGSVVDSSFESGYFNYATYTGLASFTAKPKIQNSINIVFANSTINALNSGRVANTFYISNSGNLQINAPNNNTITSKADFLTWLASNPLMIRCDLATYDEPIDISQYISDSTIQIEAGGTLTYNNTYNQAVPSEVEYLIKEAKA